MSSSARASNRCPTRVAAAERVLVIGLCAVRPLLQSDHIDPTLYSADARLWLERDKIWRKASWPVWMALWLPRGFSAFFSRSGVGSFH
jgi:hypothetical protein